MTRSMDMHGACIGLDRRRPCSHTLRSICLSFVMCVCIYVCVFLRLYVCLYMICAYGCVSVQFCLVLPLVLPAFFIRSSQEIRLHRKIKIHLQWTWIAMDTKGFCSSSFLTSFIMAFILLPLLLLLLLLLLLSNITASGFLSFNTHFRVHLPAAHVYLLLSKDTISRNISLTSSPIYGSPHPVTA